MILNNSLTVNFDINREYVLNEIMVGVRKASIDGTRVTAPSCLEGIDEYMYVPIDKEKSVIITDGLLKNFKIEKSDAWKVARKNLRKKSSIRPMSEVLSCLIGTEHGDFPDTLYVASTEDVSRGGAVGADLEMIKIFAKSHGAKTFVILPSSIHEMIIALDVDESLMQYMSDMVATVNATEVDEHERLTDRAYFVRV